MGSGRNNNNSVVIKNIEFADLSTSTSQTQIHNPEDSPVADEEINEITTNDSMQENREDSKGGSKSF